MQNIGGTNSDDPFYRYKMPKLQARIEGRGNGIKTNVVNNVEVAKALERPPDYIIKFYGCELGAQTKFDKSTGNSIVNGAHDAARLSQLLESFIRKYVQCASCNNPETVVKVRKDTITLKCRACGAVTPVDMSHKVNTYILKNPPEEVVSKAEKKLRKQEAERLKEASGEALDKEDAKKKKKDKKDKKEKERNGSSKSKKRSKDEDEHSGDASLDENEEAGAGDEGDGEEVVWATDTSAAAAKARAQEQLSAAMASMVTQGNLEAEADVEREREERRRAEEALAAKKAEEERRAAAAAKAEAEAEAAAARDKREAAAAAAVEGPVERLRAFAAGHRPAEVAAEVQGLEVEGGLTGRMHTLFQALFTGPRAPPRLAPALKERKPLLTLLSQGAPAQMAQLLALEALLAGPLLARVRETAAALKVLYEEDIVDESLIIAWHGRSSAAKSLGVSPEGAAAVRAAARPVVEWLQEEEEEEDASDEESEGED